MSPVEYGLASRDKNVMLARTITLAAALLLLPALTHAQAGIQILEAFYGEGERLCDAGYQVSSRCGGRGDCQFRVDNGLCGDPARGERKALFVAYRCSRGDDQIALYPEGAQATLRCGGGQAQGLGGFDNSSGSGGFSSRPNNRGRNIIEIDYVSYGIVDRNCDASRPFARACDGRSRCEVRVDNRLCGDPAEGRRKSAEITFWCNGRQEFGEVREGDVAYITCP